MQTYQIAAWFWTSVGVGLGGVAVVAALVGLIARTVRQSVARQVETISRARASSAGLSTGHARAAVHADRLGLSNA